MIDPQDVAAARAALGAQLAAHRAAAGLTQKALATQINYQRSSVANVETGRQNVPRQFWLTCDRVLATGSALADAYDELEGLINRHRMATATVTADANRARLHQIANPDSDQHRLWPTDHLHVRAGKRTVPAPRGAEVSTKTWPVGLGADHPVGRRRRPLAEVAAMVDECACELYVRGVGLLGTNDRRDLAAAQALLERAVSRDPRFARAIAARGYARWRHYFAGWTISGDALVGALRDVEAALAVDPDSVSAHLTFIRACWDLGWHERALATGLSIYTRNPESLDATVAYARALTNAGLAEQALPLVRSVLAQDPTNPAALKLNVWCHLLLGEYTRVADLASEYLRLHPTDANTRWAVALAYQQVAGGGTEAIRIAGEALQADPADVTLWVLLGYLHRLNADEPAAQRAWSTGLAQVQAGGVGVSNHRTRAWLANLAAGVGDADSALREVDQLTRAEPTNGYLRYRLSHVLAELGDRHGAVGMLDAAITHGFLSAQLLRQEEHLALSRLRPMRKYADVLRRLDAKVEQCRHTYRARPPVAAGTISSGRDGLS